MIPTPMPLSLRLTATAALCFFSAAAARAEVPSLAGSVPGGATAFAELSGTGDLVKRLRDSSLLKEVLQSDEYRRFAESDKGHQAEAFRATAEVMLGGSLWDAAAEVLDGRLAVALYPDPAKTYDPAPVLVLKTATATGLDRVRKVLKPLLPAFAKRVEISGGGPDTEAWTTKAGPALFVSFSSSLAVAATDLKKLEQTLKLIAAGSPAGTLAAQPEFAAALTDAKPHHLRLWGNLENVRKLTAPRFGAPEKWTDGGASLILGGLLEMAAASPHAALTLDLEPDGAALDFALTGDPAKLPEPAAIWFASPPQSGVIALPAVTGSIGGITVHRKFGDWYRQRDKLLADHLLPAFDKFETDIGNLMPQKDFGEDVLPLIGDNFTFTAAHQGFSHLGGATPGIKLPAFALIFDMTDAQRGADTFSLFFQTLAAILNLQAGQEGRQPSILDSEFYKETKISFSRFLEKPAGDRLPVAWNFQPAAASVGRKFIITTSVQYCRDLVDHFRNPAAMEWKPRNAEFTLDVPALAELAEKNEALLRSAEIGKGQSPEDAAKRIGLLLRVLKELSTVRYESATEGGAFHMRLKAGWKGGKGD